MSSVGTSYKIGVDGGGTKTECILVDGPGEIVATDNGDPTSFEPFQAPERRAFNGLCLVIVRSTKGAGQIVLEASSAGLEPARVKIKAR